MKIEEIIEIIKENDIEITSSTEPLDEGIFIGIYNGLSPDNQTITKRYVYLNDENYDKLNKALQNTASLATIKIFKWVKFFGISYIASIVAGIIAAICVFCFVD